jgi:hypothetical protein
MKNNPTPMSKTAMQELISKVRENYDNLSAEGKNFANVFFLTVAPMYEAIEKQQIIKAYQTGKGDEAYGTLQDINITGEQYYAATYHEPKK